MATKAMKIGLSSSDKATMKTQVHDDAIAQLITPYSTSSTYAVGDYCSYNGNIYKCTGATSGTWDSTKWSVATLNEVIEDVNDAVDSVDDKANQNGNYPTMTVGLAYGIASDRLIEDAEDACPAITFGTAGGSAEIQSGINKFTELRGNTVVWNQQITPYATTNNNGITLTKNADGSVTVTGTATEQAFVSITKTLPKLTSGHKYLMHTFKSSVGEYYSYFSSPYVNFSNQDTIYTANTTNNQVYFALTVAEGKTINQTSYVFFIDLTQMFGAGNEPTSVDDYRIQWAIAQATKNPEYNAGELMSAQSTSLISRQRNQWDFNDTENRYGNDCNYSDEIISNKITDARTSLSFLIQVYDSNNTFVRTINYNVGVNGSRNYYVFNSGTINYGEYIRIKHTGSTQDISLMKFRNVLSNETYNLSFELISNNPTVVGGLVLKQPMIYVNWDTPNLPYVPYEQQVVTLPNIVLRSAGSVYDVAYSVGGGKRRIGVVDLGTLEWAYSQRGYFVSFNTLQAPNTLNAVCSKYEVINSSGPIYSATQDKVLSCNYNYIGQDTNRIVVRDSAYNDAAAFKAAMSGVYLLFELATETDITTEENAGWDENVDIDNYGTLEFTSNQDVQVPQAYFIEYIVNLVELLDSMYVKLDGSADNMVLADEITDTALNTRGYYKMQDLTNQITNAGALTIDYVKAYSYGNVRNLYIVAHNESGSTISANTELFTLGTNVKPISSLVIPVGMYVNSSSTSTQALININGVSGSVKTLTSIANGDYIYITISYAAA